MDHTAWDCGLHSGIPICCIRWYHGFPWSNDEDSTYRAAYLRWAHLARTPNQGPVFWANSTRWERAQFKPCPNHLKIPPNVVLKPCPPRSLPLASMAPALKRLRRA